MAWAQICTLHSGMMLLSVMFIQLQIPTHILQELAKIHWAFYILYIRYISNNYWYDIPSNFTKYSDVVLSPFHCQWSNQCSWPWHCHGSPLEWSGPSGNHWPKLQYRILLHRPVMIEMELGNNFLCNRIGITMSRLEPKTLQFKKQCYTDRAKGLIH